MTGPFLGPAPAGPGCAHAITLDHHPCGQPPVVHVAVHTDASGLVQLPSCRRHAAIARASGDLIAEHPYGDDCDAGGCWPTNANRVAGDDRQPRSSERPRPAGDRALMGILLVIGVLALVILCQGLSYVQAGPP